MNRIACLLFLTFGVSAVAQKWDSGVPARASFPSARVSGRLYFAEFTSPRPAHELPVKNCVLFHGHGVTQELLDQGFEAFEGRPLRGVTLSQNGIPAGLVPSELQRRIDRLATLNSTEAFAYFYFGEEFIERLLQLACAKLLVPVHETTQSSILEMTLRTELFLRDFACHESCAALGHSKSGAAVTAVMRRCAEQTSEMGQAACGNLAEVYSASGAIEGLGIPVALMGARQAKEHGEAVRKLASMFLSSSETFEAGIRRLQRLEDVAQILKIDVLGEKNEHTNPVWFDMGPLAELEGGVPISVAHGSRFIPQRDGWLTRAEYSASGTSFRLDKPEYVATEGSDGVKAYQLKNSSTPFLTMGTLPSYPKRPELLPLGGGVGSRLRDLLPGKGQNLKQLLDFLWEPFLFAQEKFDQFVQARLADVHGDPNLAALYAIGRSEVAATSPALAKEMRRWGYVPPAQSSRQFVALQESDGVVDLGSALGACDRGRQAPEDVRVTDTCTTFANLHHVAVTGVSKESADDILRAFTTRRRRGR